jgi:hypothetical protein
MLYTRIQIYIQIQIPPRAAAAAAQASGERLRLLRERASQRASGPIGDKCIVHNFGRWYYIVVRAGLRSATCDLPSVSHTLLGAYSERPCSRVVAQRSATLRVSL